MVRNLVDTTLADRYRFEALIGEGTFARVYRIHDLKRNVDMAAKVLREDIAHEPTFIERFRRESEVLGQLQHPNIVRYYDMVETDGVVFILLDYIPGMTLQTHLYRHGQPLRVGEALGFIRPLCAALSYAHGENIIHRDIKPANVLLGDNDQVYITDFGIARLLGEASTLTQDTSVGTPLYMSPEQIQGGQITLATDIYAMGILLYQMLGGTLPFRGNDPRAQGSTTSERVAYEHVNLPPTPPREHNPILPESSEQVVLRCMNKEPTSRYKSAVAVYDALAESIGATPAGIAEVRLDNGSRAVPPDKTLPEWSKVVPRVQPADVITTPQERVESEPEVAEENKADTNPTLVGSSEESSQKRKTEPNLRVPKPEEIQQPIPDFVYQQPYYTTPPQKPIGRRGGGQTSMILIGLFLGMLIVAVIACAGVGLYALGVFGDDVRPTPRPTTAAQQTATALAESSLPSETSNINGGVLFPTNAPQGSPTQVAVQETPQQSDSGVRQFAYSARASGNLNIYIGDVNGGDPIQLTSSTANETGPAFSPDGSQIAYYAYSGSGPADIWLMDADGGNVRRITNTGSADERVVNWSPDGTRLAYHSDADGDFDIYVFDVNTGQTRNLTNSAFDDLGPGWSPDGERIAFHSDEDNNFNEIFIINLDGSERQQLTDGQWQAAFPAWSSDGSRITFHAITANTYNLYAINADGEGFQGIFQSENNQRHPDWSSDGQALIYMVGSTSDPRIAYTDFLTGETRDVVSSGFFPDWKP